MVYPESLCAKVMKTKYFPQGHIFGHNISIVDIGDLTSIMHGLELVKRGVIWRVVDGASINIWRDNCQPRNPGLKIFAKKNRSRIKYVSDFF